MAPRSKVSAATRRPIVKETPIPGGKILTREDGAERFVPDTPGGLPPAIYTKVKRNGGKIQGKTI